MLWTILVILLILWIVGGPIGYEPLHFNGHINWVLVLIVILLILALSGGRL